MRLPPGLSFQRKIRPIVYAGATAGLLASQYAVVAATYSLAGQQLTLSGRFWLLPLRTFAELPGISALSLAGGFAFSLLIAGVLAWLSCRRATTSGQGHSLAALSVVPVLQLPAVVALMLMPRRSEHPYVPTSKGLETATVIQGVLAGVGLIVFGVVLSALVFRAYGSGMFLLTPLLVGVTTAYMANRQSVQTFQRTMKLVTASLVISGLALLLLALEGAVCILMAAPLAIVMSMLGATIGRAFAVRGHRRARPMAMSVAVLPLIFALEAALPPAVVLDTHESIEIAASPAEVWKALTQMGEIGPAPGVLFRLGLAYPVRGEMKGEGVGAERTGVFSTGVARERIAVWSPERRLEFVVLSNPPLMTEYSPYETVHAPHVNGYFETGWTRFDLEALPGGRTRLVERATHTLRLDPVLYWAPMVRWGIDQNNARVLEHVRATAEAAAARPKQSASLGR